MNRRHAAALAALSVLWLLLGLSFIRSAAPTYDEPVHLASGYSYWADGRFRLNIMDHPPLAEMWAALPLNFVRPHRFLSHPDWLRRRLYHYADHFIFQNGLSGERLTDIARTFSFVTLSALLAGILVLWGLRLGGAPAALGAVGAAALSPILISNLALTTTDGLSAVLFFAVFWLLSDAGHSRRKWAAAGVCAGFALAAKFNMIVLGPFAAGILLADYGLRLREYKKKGKKGERPRVPWVPALLAAVCAAAALALCYRVDQLPLYWEGLSATLKRLGQGRSAFFHGEHAITGFWLFFPASLLLKSPIPLLGLALWGVLQTRKENARAMAWVILPALAYFAAAMSSKVQIGVRHLLPMLPFMALLAGLGAARLWDRGRRGRLGLALLALWTLASVARVHPYQLAYFNELVGGPARGHEWFVDSSLDWGQDLEGLAEELRRMGRPPLYLSYFGSADPEAYGIRYVPVWMCCNVTRRGSPVDPAREGRVLFAVSATNYHAVYFRDKDIFSWLKEREPIRRIGHTIFLYDLTDDRAARAKLSGLVFAFTRDPGRAKSLVLE